MPIFMAFGLLLFVLGASFTMNNWGEEDSNAHWLLITSFAVIWGTMFFWFGSVIKENDSGMYSGQLNQSFVWGMAWFIFSEVMFFFAFFLALGYVRLFAVPWLGGEGEKAITNILWPGFEAAWPNPQIEASPIAVQISVSSSASHFGCSSSLTAFSQPTLHGVHCPQLSSSKNLSIFNAASLGLSTWDKITTAADPINVSSDCKVSKSMGTSSIEAGSRPEEGPPG